MHNQQESPQQKPTIRHSTYRTEEEEGATGGTTATTVSMLTANASFLSEECTMEWNELPLLANNLERPSPSLSKTISTTDIHHHLHLHQNQDLLPPISQLSLCELEEASICSNVQILHDLLLEPHLRIKPNLEKRNSLDSIRKSEAYWALIRQEIQTLSRNASQSIRSQIVSPRLRMLLAEIKGILVEMYPESQALQQTLAEHMDIDMMVADLEMGYFDPICYASILHSVIKINCAPKRDGLVEGLVGLAEAGKFVELLKGALELCELMKLDLINYRLARLRPTYQASYARIEREHFGRRHGSGLSKIPPITKTWLKRIIIQSTSSLDFTAILSGTIDLCCVLLDEPAIPETFGLDARRIVLLRSRYQDLCILASLLLVFRQWCRRGEGSPGFSLILEDLKGSLEEMLRHPETRISAIAETIFQSLLLVPQSPPLLADQAKLYTQIDRIMDPESPVVQVLNKKMHGMVKRACTTTTDQQLLDEDRRTWNRHGLADIQADLLQLSRGICTMAWVNWTVYEDVYRQGEQCYD